MSREVKNTNGLKIQEWTALAEAVAKVTPQFKLLGGFNYNFPSMTGAADGASIKGKIGYQFGASYQFTSNVAFDGRYRSLEMETTGKDAATGESVSTTIKLAGFMLGGRYTF
jgi:opacity protein-like surface antigen